MDFDGNSDYAVYHQFHMHGPEDFYRLSVSGFEGTAGNCLLYTYFCTIVFFKLRARGAGRGDCDDFRSIGNRRDKTCLSRVHCQGH